MEDHSAGASMKSVDQSEIRSDETQEYVNHWYSNTYGCKPAHYAEQALQGFAARNAIKWSFGCLHSTRPRTELKHINKSRRRNQNEIGLVAASEQPRAGPESERSCGCALNWCKLPWNR